MLTYIKKNMHITGRLTARSVDGTRYVIFEDGAYYGVFDIKRKTFVD